MHQLTLPSEPSPPQQKWPSNNRVMLMLEPPKLCYSFINRDSQLFVAVACYIICNWPRLLPSSIRRGVLRGEKPSYYSGQVSSDWSRLGIGSMHSIKGHTPMVYNCGTGRRSRVSDSWFNRRIDFKPIMTWRLSQSIMCYLRWALTMPEALFIRDSGTLM